MKFLVVDDFPTMRRIVRNLLQQIGYTNIQEAEDGSDALKKLRAISFDFVVTDWNMPKMTGLELLKNIRDDQSISEIMVLMITAEARRDQIVEAAQAGVDGYVIKPFNATTLKEKINGILRKRGKQPE